MKRTALCIDKCKHQKTFIAVDDLAAPEICQYLWEEKVIKEFQIIRSLLKDGNRNREYYCKCDVSDKAKDIFEMRFTNNGKNDRIYCKEVSTQSKRYIIMIELYVGKKSQDIPKQQKGRINTMGGYDYENNIREK